MKSILKVTVTSTIELTEKQVKRIVDAVEKKYSAKEVELKQVVTPSVIAGIKLTIGSQEIDATAQTKLAQLHQELKENL